MRMRDWLAFGLLGLIWGSSFLWIKLALAEIGPFLLVSLRILFGVLALLVIVIVRRPRWPKSRSTWIALLFLGWINNAAPYVLISWGEQYIDSAVAAILNSTAPLFTMIIAHFFLSDDRLTLTRFSAILVGFGGIVLLMSRDLKTGIQIGLLGQGAVLLAALFYAISSVYARRITRGLPLALQVLIPLLGADGLLWLITPMVEAPVVLPRLPLTWLAVIWLGTLGVAAAFFLYFYLLHSVGPTRTILVTYIFPLVGVILGVLFLNESLDWQLITGGGCIVASIAIVNRQR